MIAIERVPFWRALSWFRVTKRRKGVSETPIRESRSRSRKKKRKREKHNRRFLKRVFFFFFFFSPSLHPLLLENDCLLAGSRNAAPGSRRGGAEVFLGDARELFFVFRCSGRRRRRPFLSPSVGLDLLASQRQLPGRRVRRLQGGRARQLGPRGVDVADDLRPGVLRGRNGEEDESAMKRARANVNRGESSSVCVLAFACGSYKNRLTAFEGVNSCEILALTWRDSREK